MKNNGKVCDVHSLVTVYNQGFERLCPGNLKMDYCKLVIIRHVPIFAIFISVRHDELTYWRI